MACIAFAANVFADENSDERLKTYQADEVIIIAAPKDDDELSEKTPANVTVINREDFENKSLTVPEVLAATPGASISTMGGLGDYSEMSIRGSYSNQVQVYLDGMLLNDSFGGAVNLSAIPLAQVESIEVYRSGAPGIYGGDAIGGVVNIRTSRTGKTRKALSLGYGSFNTFNSSLAFDIPMGLSKLRTTVDYSSSDNNFEYESDNGTSLNNSDDYRTTRYNDEYRSLNILSRYSAVIGSNAMLNISEHILSSGKNIPRTDNARYSSASLSTVRSLTQAKLDISGLLGDKLDLSPAIHFSHTREHYEDRDNTIGWGAQDDIYESSVISSHMPATYQLSETSALTLTGLMRHERFSPEAKLQSYTPLSSMRNRFALIADVSHTAFNERLTLTGSARSDHSRSNYDGQASVLNRKTPEAVITTRNGGQAGLKFRLANWLSFRSNYGVISRIPTLYELYGDRGSTLSNPNLKPERINKWDTGVKFSQNTTGLVSNASFEAVYFENDFHDLIQWYTTDAGFIHPENVARSYVKGIELIWSGTLHKRFSINGSWTFQDSKVIEEKRIYYRDKELPNRPKSYGSLSVEYRSSLASVFWRLDRKGGYYLDRSNAAHKRYPGRALHDAGLTLPLLNKTVALVMTARNIADVRTFDISGMPKPGRSYNIEIKYTL